MYGRVALDMLLAGEEGSGIEGSRVKTPKWCDVGGDGGKRYPHETRKRMLRWKSGKLQMVKFVRVCSDTAGSRNAK